MDILWKVEQPTVNLFSEFRSSSLRKMRKIGDAFGDERMIRYTDRLKYGISLVLKNGKDQNMKVAFLTYAHRFGLMKDGDYLSLVKYDYEESEKTKLAERARRIVNYFDETGFLWSLMDISSAPQYGMNGDLVFHITGPKEVTILWSGIFGFLEKTVFTFSHIDDLRQMTLVVGQKTPVINEMPVIEEGGYFGFGRTHEDTVTGYESVVETLKRLSLGNEYNEGLLQDELSRLIVGYFSLGWLSDEERDYFGIKKSNVFAQMTSEDQEDRAVLRNKNLF